MSEHLVERDKNGRFIKGKRYSINTEFKSENLIGSNNPNWKGGRRKNSAGYILIYSPNHPRANKNKPNGNFIYEHIIVAENKIGRFLNKGECVHHINGLKDDNSEDNLLVCSSRKEHFSHHRGKNNKCYKNIDMEYVNKQLSIGIKVPKIASILKIHHVTLYKRIRDDRNKSI